MAALEIQEPIDELVTAPRDSAVSSTKSTKSSSPRKSKTFRLGSRFKRNSKKQAAVSSATSTTTTNNNNNNDTQPSPSVPTPTQVLQSNEPWTFPTASQIVTPPESFEFSKWYNFDEMDSKIEAHLLHKFAHEIAALHKFKLEVIVRFVIGYRHTAKTSHDYEKRVSATEQSFAAYLEWHQLSRFASILEQPIINKLQVHDYMVGSFVYGHDKYGHPLLWDDGAKFTKNAAADTLPVHKQLNVEQMDQVLGYSMRLLQEVKSATNRFYGFPVSIAAEDPNGVHGATEEVKQATGDAETEEKEEEKTAAAAAPPVAMTRSMSAMSDTKKGDNYRQIGIYRHCLIFDLKTFNSKSVLKERKLHEYYTKRGSLIGPDVVHRVYVINAPKVFQGVWKLLKKFLHPNTIQKTIILGNNYLPHLTQEIDIHMIPPQFGGKGEWIPQYADLPKGFPIQLSHSHPQQ